MLQTAGYIWEDVWSPPQPTSPIRLELTLNTKAVLQVNINLMQ